MNTISSLMKYFEGPSTSSGQGYRQPTEQDKCQQERAPELASLSSLLAKSHPSQHPLQPKTTADSETFSGSVDIEDVIGEYDEPSSRLSLSDVASIPSGQQRSRRQPQTIIRGAKRKHSSITAQSFLSLSNLVSSSQSYKTAKDNDETVSFYSALQNGFSLDEYEWRDRYGQDFFWTSQKPNLHSRNGERDMMLQATDFQVIWSDLTYTINRPITNISSAWHDLRRFLYKFLSSNSSKSSTCSRSNEKCNIQQPRSNEDELDEQPIRHVDSSKVTILEQLSGSFKSGQLTAIMGPSGAGKTSLLNILSRRCEDVPTGSLYVESEESDQHKIKISSIPQHDLLPEYLTVRENLMFASRLKNSGANHEKNVCRVSNLLGLDDCLDTKTRNISGGQHKRVAIAQELLSRPDILILDEPTSGLDSSTCIKTLFVLKDLVRASAKKIIDPIAIVLTIHQPQQEAFDLFDKVYVMANKGVAIYDGPPGNCIEFVQKHANISMPSPDYNPASFMIDIASGEYGQEPIKQLEHQIKIEFDEQRGKKLKTQLHSKETNPSTDDQNDKIIYLDNSSRASNLNSRYGYSRCANQNSFQLDPRLIKGSEMNSGEFFYKTRVLTERCWHSITRDPQNIVTRILFHLFLPFGMSLMLGTEPGQANACPRYREDYSLFGLVKSDDYISPELQEEFLLGLENIGVLFITIYSCISANIAAMTLVFAQDMNSSLKEYYNGWYTMNSYLFARILSNVPLDLTLPTATMALMYIVTGQNTGSGSMPDLYRITITALAVIIGSITGQMMGMIFGAIYMGHVTTALFASQGATLPFVLLSGFVARTKNMSSLVRVLSLTSLFRHCLEISFIARYGWNVCGCESNEAQGKEPRITGIPEKLQNFVDYWQEQQANHEDDTPSNATKQNLFRMMAKQISLYNTYGIEVKSCEQVVPYELSDFMLTESDLPYKFAALICLALIMLIILILVVKFVITYRTSL